MEDKRLSQKQLKSVRYLNKNLKTVRPNRQDSNDQQVNFSDSNRNIKIRNLATTGTKQSKNKKVAQITYLNG